MSALGKRISYCMIIA